MPLRTEIALAAAAAMVFPAFGWGQGRCIAPRRLHARASVAGRSCWFHCPERNRGVQSRE